MRSNKRLTISQRLYLLTVDTNAKAFAKLDREETAGIRSWWTWRLFHWHSLMHGELMSRLAAHDAQAAEIARLTAEVAALRPAADAYRACVRWENASSYGTADECASAWTEYLAATRRAIAFVPGATP